jgi:GNAT superfamily N-acetyltransferase
MVLIPDELLDPAGIEILELPEDPPAELLRRYYDTYAKCLAEMPNAHETPSFEDFEELQRVTGKGGLLAVAHEDDNWIGVVLVRADTETTATLTFLGVLPQGRGRRIGIALGARPFRWARDRGITLAMTTDASNRPILDFWERNGAILTGVTHELLRDAP